VETGLGVAVGVEVSEPPGATVGVEVSEPPGATVGAEVSEPPGATVVGSGIAVAEEPQASSTSKSSARGTAITVRGFLRNRCNIGASRFRISHGLFVA